MCAVSHSLQDEHQQQPPPAGWSFVAHDKCCSEDFADDEPSSEEFAADESGDDELCYDELRRLMGEFPKRERSLG